MVEREGAAVDRVLRALAHPVRRDILERLALGERTVSQLAEPFDMSLQAISQHIQVLERVKLVRRDRRSRERPCRLNVEPLREVEEVLMRLGGFWDRRLDRLEAWLEQGPDEGQPRR